MHIYIKIYIYIYLHTYIHTCTHTPNMPETAISLYNISDENFIN